MPDKEKKKFKETKFGSFLINKIPKAAGVIGDLLPSQGVFGIAKNLIGAAAKDGTINATTAEELMSELQHEEEMYRIEVEDRSSARIREVELAKTGKKDTLMFITGVVGLVCFLFIVYAAIMMEIKNENLFYFIAGNVMGVVISMFAYYFGSSKGSKDKTDALKNFKQ